MLNQLEKSKQKWGGAHSAIDRCLSERKQLLILFCQLAGLAPFEKSLDRLPVKADIESFCEILMDYVSSGHFEMYDKIAVECGNENIDCSHAEQIYSLIAGSTEIALDFNDAFADIQPEQDMRSFDIKLSALGQCLEERFELEDKLIETLHP